MDPLPLPAPYGGIDEAVPPVALSSPNCEQLFNFNIAQGQVQLRNGDSKYLFKNDATYASNFEGLFSYGDAKGFTAVEKNATDFVIYDVDTGTASKTLTSTVVGSPAPFFFNKKLFVFFSQPPGGLLGVVFDGSSWADVAYTGPSKILSGTVYNGRAYFTDGSGGFWYSDSLSTSGALTFVDQGQYVSRSATLELIAPITLSDNLGSQTYLAFVYDSGEVLFFSGAYPDDNTWSFISAPQIGTPLDSFRGLKFEGDHFIFTSSGLISLRNLFLQGQSSAVTNGVGSRLQHTWNTVIKNIIGGSDFGSGFFRAIYDKANQRIVVGMRADLGNLVAGQSASSKASFFIYDTVLGSWSFHQSAGPKPSASLAGMMYFKNKILFQCSASVNNGNLIIWQKEGATGFTDISDDNSTQSGFYYSIKSAPISGVGTVTTGTISKDRQYYSQNPSGTAFVKQITGLDILIQTDMLATSNWILIADLGRLSTTSQQIPQGTTGVDKTYLDVGIEGTYIQYQLSGTSQASKTVGLTLYGVNVWIDQGGSPR